MSRVDEKLLKEAKKLPWEDRLLHKNWKVRNDANIDLTALFDSITDPKDPRIRELGHFFRKTVADSHARVQDKALDALIAYLKAADADATRRYAKEVCDAVVATCLTGCPKTVEKAQLVFMLWVELDSVDIFLDAMENATKHKDAKAVVPAIDVMFQALSEFGSKIVPPKRLLKMLPELFDHQDKNVRASSKELTLELCRWIGIDVVKSMLFRTMRDTTKKELEAELANVTGSAKPTRKIRSEQDKETKQEVQAGPSEESAAETPQEIDEYELVQEVDILTPLEKSGFWNGVKATKWSERKEAVAELTKLASTKRIAPGDFSEICRTLKKLITDVNIAVGVQAVQAVGNLALGLRTNFSRSSRFILPVLLEKLKEKKPTMTEALTNTLQAIHKAGCVTLADIVEDIKAAVKSKVPIVRSLTLNWVTHCMERSNRAVILKVHQDYVLICVECLNDGTRDVMDAAISVLAAIAKVVGMRALKNSLEKLDDVSQKKILDMVGFSGSGAPTVTRSVASLGGAASSAEVRQENDDTPLILTHKSAKFTLPGNIKKGLLEHQIEGIKWLWGLHVNQVGGILGDDMGVGKTRQISAFLAGLYNSKLTNKVLLVCPKTLLPQWSDEFLKMGLPPSNIYHGEDKIEELENFKQKDKGILLTTYTMVTLDGDSLCSLTLDYIILDEGHTIKNWKSKICENIKSIPSLHRIVVTGTPMQNNYEEIWTLFSFCAHKVFGDLDSFKKDVETPLVKGIQKFASIREKQLCITAKRKLDKALEHHLLRRTKDEVLSDFPNKTELVVWLKLDECQRELYKSIQESEIFSVACHSVPLAALIMLRKICSHPYLTGLSEGDKEEKTCGSEDGVLKDARILALKMNELTTTYPARLTSSKISFIKSLVVDLVKNHHILIFCQWKKMMDLIKVSLEKEDFECVRMDGNSSSEERKGAIEKFQSGKAKVFLLTSGVGGVGLNLTKADRVILADSAWNPSIDNQCADRAYRIGQTRNVVVYRILTCGTVEEAIYKTQVYKSSLIGSAMESELQCSYFTTKEKKACLEKTNFGFSSSINVLLKKQNREAKKNSILQQHIKHLNSLSHIAAILNHSSLFPKPAPKKPPPISDMGRETPNRITWYDELVAREENHDNEEKDHKASDGSSGRPSFGAETRPRSSSLSKTRNEWFKDTTTTSVVSEEKRDNEEKVVSPGNHNGPPSLGAQTRPGSPSLPKTRNDHGSHCPPTMPGPRGNFLRPHMTGRMPRQDPRRVPSPMSYQPNHPGMRPEMHESFNRQGMPGFYPRPRYHPNYHGRPP